MSETWVVRSCVCACACVYESQYSTGCLPKRQQCLFLGGGIFGDFLLSFKSEFLELGTIDILSQGFVFCFSPVHCGVFSSTHGPTHQMPVAAPSPPGHDDPLNVSRRRRRSPGAQNHPLLGTTVSNSCLHYLDILTTSMYYYHNQKNKHSKKIFSQVI